MPKRTTRPREPESRGAAARGRSLKARARPAPSPPEQHKASAPERVGCGVVTVSDSKSFDTDVSGRRIRDMLETAGHLVAERRIVRDDPPAIRRAILALLDRPEVSVVVLTGGTGITARDSTYEVVSALLEKTLPGFGEMFRWLSYAEIGSAAIMSRAILGVRGGKAIASLPGSPAACELAVGKLLLPELGHLASLAAR